MTTQPRRLESVCVFGGSSPGTDPLFLSTSHSLGVLLGNSNIRLVYGGGTAGVMGAAATGCSSVGGAVLGICPTAFMDGGFVDASTSPGTTVFVGTMHERKERMMGASDAFVALPGGFGTFEEVFEMVTWLQLGIHNKPVALLNVNGYYDPIVEMVKSAVRSGFIRESQAGLLIVADSPTDLLDKLKHSDFPINTLNLSWPDHSL
jgi:uncharacterized protein (TIGR00730 family)